jgi:phage tail sheath protein FI
MPNTYKTPGVYIQEVNAFHAPIVPAETGVTLILGDFADGRDWPVQPERFFSVRDCEALFGEMTAGDPLCTAIQRYFSEGGRIACMARYAPAAGFRVSGLSAQVDKLQGFDVIITAPPAPDADWPALLSFAQDHQAFLLLDGAQDGTVLSLPDLEPSLLSCGAIYSPWLRNDDGSEEPPSAAVAGVVARTDTNVGVWRAPAGVSAGLSAHVVTVLRQDQMAALNQAGQNAIRFTQAQGTMIWGARTMAGADGGNGDYRYVPVKRLAQFVERSISQSLAFAAFEPNDAKLGNHITQVCSTFLRSQWAAGAFVGSTEREAFIAYCDSSTTTPEDVANGVANVMIGFAPTHPAEFLVLRISVKAGGGV